VWRSGGRSFLVPPWQWYLGWSAWLDGFTSSDDVNLIEWQAVGINKTLNSRFTFFLLFHLLCCLWTLLASRGI